MSIKNTTIDAHFSQIYSHMCRFELDDLTEYHLLAVLNATLSVDSAIKLNVERRLTWYCVLILLTLP